jgi:hypothetical protein
MKAVRLALLAYTPTPLHVPVYRLLELDRRVDFTVIFCSDAGLRPADMGYGLPVPWGSELLSGYKSLFLRRARKNPGIVVSDRVGCGRDLVSSGRNGWFASTDDTDTLAARFDSLLASSELRQRFGKESLAIIDEWSPEKTAEGIASAALYAAGGSSDTQHISSAMRCPGWVGSSGVKRCNL